MKHTFLAFTLIAASAFAQPFDSAHPSTPLGVTLSLSKGQGKPAPATITATTIDARFASWVGCWRLEDDLSGTGARMCMTPEPSGIRMQTVIGTQKGIDELVIPDGVARPIVDAECKGTEKAEWSNDGTRVFRVTDVTCGTEAARVVKSVAFMGPGPAWINVQHVSGSAANTSVRVQRYRRSTNQQLADGSRAPQADARYQTRTTPDQTTWNTEDIIEANGKLPIEAMQAVLTEVHHKFDLNRKTLVALDDAGVSDGVLDLMVALTYPNKFVVERAGGGGAPSGIMTGTGWFDPFMTPMLMGGLADCYTPRGFGYRSYYSMCGLGYYDRFGYYGYNNYYSGYNGYYSTFYPGGWIDVGSFTGPGGLPADSDSNGNGRVVSGRGFTQIRTREADPSPRFNGGSNGGGWSGAGGSGGGSSGASSGSGFSSGGGSSSGGGGGDSGARVAVPKGGGH